MKKAIVILVEYFVLAIALALDLLGAIGRLIAKAKGENYEEPNRFASVDAGDDPDLRQTPQDE